MITLTKLSAGNTVLAYKNQYYHATRKVRDEQGNVVPATVDPKDLKKHVILNFTVSKGYVEGESLTARYVFCKKQGKTKQCISSTDLNTSFLHRVVQMDTGKRFVVIKTPNFYLISRGGERQQEVLFDTESFDPNHVFPGSTDWVEIDLDSVYAKIDSLRFLKRLVSFTMVIVVAVGGAFLFDYVRQVIEEKGQEVVTQIKKQRKLDAIDEAQTLIEEILSTDLGVAKMGDEVVSFRHIEKVDFTGGYFVVGSLFPEKGFKAFRVYSGTEAVIFGKEVKPRIRYQTPTKGIKYCYNMLKLFGFKLVFRDEEKILVKKGKMATDQATQMLYTMRGCPLGIYGTITREEPLFSEFVNVDLEVKLHERVKGRRAVAGN